MHTFHEIHNIPTLRFCAELFRDANNAPPWNDAWTEATAFQRLQDIFHTPQYYGLALAKEDRIAGFILGAAETYFDARHFNLKEMVIAPGHQRAGLGRALLEELERRLVAQGVSEVLLFTSRENRTHEFYEKSGYACWDSMTMMGKTLR